MKKVAFPALFDEGLKDKIKGMRILETYLKDLNRAVDGYKEKPVTELPYSFFVTYYRNGNRLQYEEVYFERRRRLMVYGLAAWLYGRIEDYKALEDVLWAICNEYSWALPAHTAIDEPYAIDLFAAETAFALAEITSGLEAYLDQEVTQRCRKEIRKRVLYPYMISEVPYNWERMTNNWCAVCAGSIGVAAIYLEEEDFIRRIHGKLKPTLNRFIDSFEADGTCLEGLGYWTYGMAFYVAYVDLLRNIIEEEAGMLANRKIFNIAEFQQKCYWPDGGTVSFSDCERHQDFQPGLTAYLSAHYDNVTIPPLKAMADLESDQCYRWCHGLRNLIWTASYGLDRVSTGQKSYQLPEAQWLIRQDRYGLAVKGGHNDEPHNHNDVGSFIVWKEGADLVTDLGSGEYTKQYFSDARYEIFCNSSLGHSVPIIDGQEQKHGKSHGADLIEMDDWGILMEIARAYDLPKLKSLERKVASMNDQGILLEDTYEMSEGEVTVVERFITVWQPEILGKDVRISDGISVIYLEMEGTQISEQIHIQTHTHSMHNGKKTEVYSVDFTYVLPKGKSQLKFRLY